MKLLVDIAKLEAEGKLTPDQALEIRRIAAGETASLAINVLSALGVFAIVGGVVALQPRPIVGALLAAASIGTGLLLKQYRDETFGLLGSTFVFIGALGLSAATLAQWGGNIYSFSFCTAIFLILGVVLRQSLFVALSVFSIAALIGSSTGYSHASYYLWVNEASITIVIFSLLALGAYVLSLRVGEYEKLARIFALLSIIWINFGFWVGSLWGDYPGASWVRAELLYSEDFSMERYRELQEWYKQAFFIPAEYFAVVWAVGLISLGIWAAFKNQRAVLNAVTTFAAIHFYTQWFERLGATPMTMIIAGAIAVGIAFSLWRYNRKGLSALAVNQRSSPQ